LLLAGRERHKALPVQYRRDVQVDQTDPPLAAELQIDVIRQLVELLRADREEAVEVQRLAGRQLDFCLILWPFRIPGAGKYLLQ
jgi:hypothetical protein